MKNNQNNNIPMLIGSIIVIICVTVLTVFASKSIVGKLNANADKAYAEAIDNVNKLKMNDSKKSQSDKKADTRVLDKYNIADIIEIDGKYYIKYSKINDNTGDVQSPITVDVNTIVTVDGEDYALISTKEPIDIDDKNKVDDKKYVGEEYVVVDIDGNLVYLIQKDDTLSEISGKVAYSVDELAEYNHIKNVDLIYEGESLRIPASDEAIKSIKNK